MSDEVENELVSASKPPGLVIWNEVEATDPKYVKPFKKDGYEGDSANPTWLFKQATRVFGPAGIGWGYVVESQEFIDGPPILINKEPTGLVEKLHTARVRLWYKVPADDLPPHLIATIPEGHSVEGSVYGVGHTPFMYLTQSGRVFYDKEYEKKSITDAVTKALALLGFAADIRMGMWDEADYVLQQRDEFGVANAVDQAAAKLTQLTEFNEWFDKNVELMKTSVSLRELEYIYKPGIIRVTRQGNKDQVQAFTDAKNLAARRLLDTAKEKATTVVIAS